MMLASKVYPMKIRTVALMLCLLMAACSASSTSAPQPVATSTLGVDVEMESAFRAARNTLNTFTQKIETPQANRTYVAVKVRFYPPETVSQDIWVDGVTYQNGVIRGNMGDDIPALKLSFGKNIVVNTNDILDWMLVEDGKLSGGYTIRLAYQRMSPEEQERFLKSLDYSLGN